MKNQGSLTYRHWEVFKAPRLARAHQLITHRCHKSHLNPYSTSRLRCPKITCEGQPTSQRQEEIRPAQISVLQASKPSSGTQALTTERRWQVALCKPQMIRSRWKSHHLADLEVRIDSVSKIRFRRACMANKISPLASHSSHNPSNSSQSKTTRANQWRSLRLSSMPTTLKNRLKLFQSTQPMKAKVHPSLIRMRMVPQPNRLSTPHEETDHKLQVPAPRVLMRTRRWARSRMLDSPVAEAVSKKNPAVSPATAHWPPPAPALP